MRAGSGVKPRYVLIAVGALVLILMAMGVSRYVTSGDHARPGSTVQGVDIGGMTREEAAAAVESGLAGMVTKRIRVRLPNHIATIKPTEAGLTIDAVASVAPAFGRTLNPLALLGGVAGSNDFPAVIKVDEAALEKQIAGVADNLDTPAQEPSIDITGTRVSLTPARPGAAVDRKATAAAIVAALLKPRAPVDALIKDIPPRMPELSCARQEPRLGHPSA